MRISRRSTIERCVKVSARCVAVAVAIFSWIAVSNHCAFAAVGTKTNKAQIECPFHSKPAKQKEQSSQVQCCKILRAVVFTQSKAWTRDDTNFQNANLPLESGPLLVYSVRAVAPLLLGIGPPFRGFSFAELILQQSLLVHAPPVIA